MTRCRITVTRHSCSCDGSRHYYKATCSTSEGSYICTEGISLDKDAARQEAIDGMREWLTAGEERWEEDIEL